MAIKYVRRCAASLVIWKMQIQTQCSTPTHPLEWPKVKRPAIPSVGEELDELEPSYTAGGNIKWCNHFGEQFVAVSQKVKYTYIQIYINKHTYMKST